MFFDELKINDEFVSPSRTITDAHYLFFAGLTGDNHPSHYDVEFCRKTRFGKPVAHGLLLASMTALGGSYINSKIDGFIFLEQGCRFLKPVVVGDTISIRFRVDEKWRKGDRGFVRFKTLIMNQREECVLEGFHLYLVDLNLQDEKES
ncbi:MAG: MaoC family dehydratase [Syntrophales bacterium]